MARNSRMLQELSEYSQGLDYFNTTHSKAFKAGWKARAQNLSKDGNVNDRYLSKLLRQLERYLPMPLVVEVELSCALKADIGICMTVNRIIEQYNSTQQDEAAVVSILQKILKLHFS